MTRLPFLLVLLGGFGVGFMATYFLIGGGVSEEVAPRVIYQEFYGLDQGVLLERGMSSYRARNYVEAARIFRAAFEVSDRGSTSKSKAAYMLAVLHRYGWGVPKDVQSMYHYAQIHVEAGGSRDGYYTLGLAYADTKCTCYDLAKAKTYLAKAESLGVKGATAVLKRVGQN